MFRRTGINTETSVSHIAVVIVYWCYSTVLDKRSDYPDKYFFFFLYFGYSLETLYAKRRF